jgi:hypothetical protein
MSDVKMVRDPKSGLYIPNKIAEEIGFGCPKCDDHELVPVAQMQHGISAIIAKFRKKHENCGMLHTLEKRGGRVYATGEVSSRSVALR